MQHAEVFPTHTKSQSESVGQTNRVFPVECHLVVAVVASKVRRLKGTIDRRVISISRNLTLGIDGNREAGIHNSVQQVLRIGNGAIAVFESREGVVVAKMAKIRTPFEGVLAMRQGKSCASRDRVLRTTTADAADVATRRQISWENNGVTIQGGVAIRKLNAGNRRAACSVWSLRLRPAEG